MIHHESSQDRPTLEPPETTPIFYTHTALGPAVVGTDDPTDNTILYHNVGTTTAPVATTTVSFPAEVTPAQRGRTVTHTTTFAVYLSTTTVTSSPSANRSVIPRDIQKRQTCSMIFASIDGQWASWCNEWNGHTTVKYSTYNTTTLITHPPGADPIPTSVYESSETSEIMETIQTSPPEPSESSATSEPIASPPSSPTLSATEGEPVTTEIVVTASVTITYPIATVSSTVSDASSSSTSDVPAPSSSCGQIGNFVITFDDLPTFSTSKPDNETTAPPIFDPYSHFYWSAGYGYGPPPNEPFSPNDGDRLAEYNPAYENPNATGNAQGRDLPGSFGAGTRSFNSIFWFDAKSVFVGCNNTDPGASCDITATGYRWTASSAPNGSRFDGHEELAFIQSFPAPELCATKPCPLTKVSFDATQFSGLSTLNLVANIGDQEVGFYLDTFEAAWTNNTCEAGLERSMSRR